MRQLLIDFGKKILYGFGFGTGMGIPYYFSRNVDNQIYNIKINKSSVDMLTGYISKK